MNISASVSAASLYPSQHNAASPEHSAHAAQSEEAEKQQSAQAGAPSKQTQNESDTDSSKQDKAQQENTREINGREFSEDDFRVIQELKQRDAEVRAHEQAHLAAAGQYATGGASYSYQQGPDGKRYAVGGEVGIDTSPIADDPRATLQKARQIRAAALAPAEPSGQDRAVAAQASQMAAQAQQQIAQEASQKQEESTGEAAPIESQQQTESKEAPQSDKSNPRAEQQAKQYQQIAAIDTEQSHQLSLQA